MCYVCVCIILLSSILFYYYYYYLTHSLLYVYFLGTRYCTTCVQGNKECCVEDCMDNRHSHERDCLYCERHSDPKTRCRKCKRRGLPDGSESGLCSMCNLLCRKKGCEKAIVDGVTKLCSTCLVEAEAIAKEKVLERKARCRTKNLMRKKQLEHKARELEKELERVPPKKRTAAPKKKPAPTYEQIQQEIARHQAKVTKALEKPFWKYG